MGTQQAFESEMSKSPYVKIQSGTMAVDATDPRSLKSWEDAFQYPIPTVRVIEKKLRGSLDENHEKLRTLVG